MKNVKPSINIGTSGWSYDHWQGPFYPQNLAKKEYLTFYTNHFSTVEINNSFYHLPKVKSLETWQKTVPPHFIFAVKASRFITHMKKLKDTQESVTFFLKRMRTLKHTLGPVLFQLPPGWKLNVARLADFLSHLPREHRYAFEFRNPQWFNQEVYDILSRSNIAFCIYELNRQMSPLTVTTDIVYIRLHGPEGAYQGQYSRAVLATWAQRIIEWHTQGKEIFCYFDNDQAGYAAQDASTLANLLDQ